MRKGLLTTILILVLATGAFAQTAVYVGGGLSLPSGDLADGWKTGFGATGAIGITVAPSFQIVPKVEFHTFGLDADKFLAELEDVLGEDLNGVTIDGGSFSAIMFGADGRFAFGLPEAKMKPFVFGGLGMAIAKISDITASYEGESETVLGTSETKLYFNFGAGIEFEASPTMNIFIQGRYVSISTEGSTTFMPLTVRTS